MKEDEFKNGIARERIATVQSQIDSHEKHCIERWDEARKSWDRVYSQVDKLHARIGWLQKFLLLTIVAIAGTALIQWFTVIGVAK